MNGTSWTHLIARVLVRPLLGTWVRPNHLTTLRVVTGVVACVFFALGTSAGMGWGGAFWLISAFLDRADGELARIGNMMSRGGHVYDYYADTAINAGFFLAIGVGLRHSWLGNWSYVLGAVTGVSMFLCSLFSEWLELRSLMGPLAWLGWLSAVLVGASVGAPLMMTLVGIRLLRLRQAGALSTPHAITPKLSTFTE
jgi:archaetidylinositol phosphate synthase